MKRFTKGIIAVLLMVLISGLPTNIHAKEKAFSIPENVLSITKENTFPNITEDVAVVEPSEETKTLLKTIEESVDNPQLIALLNETSIQPSIIGIGYRASIYLGRFPLQYKSEHTSVIWDYQAINNNELSNVGGKEVQKLQYNQKENKEIKGALTNKITDADTIKKMILENAKQKTKLPLSFTTKIGKNTKLNHYYHVTADKSGLLEAYAPAVNEKGKVTFGEVYVRLQGTKKAIEIKNITKQGIGAWIPIQDHVALSFQLEDS